MTPLRQIGTVARELGVTPRTLRYYEGLGLIQPTIRLDNGARLYDEEAFARLQLIKRLQAIGYSLEMIRLTLNARTEIEQLIQQPAAATQLEGLVQQLRESHTRMRTRVCEIEAELALARQLEEQLAHELHYYEQNLEQHRRIEK